MLPTTALTLSAASTLPAAHTHWPDTHKSTKHKNYMQLLTAQQCCTPTKRPTQQQKLCAACTMTQWQHQQQVMLQDLLLLAPAASLSCQTDEALNSINALRTRPCC
jgi:hypothetical protein